MRVAILTYQSIPNYGANLQILATTSLLRQMGHTVLVYDWYPASLRVKDEACNSLEQREACRRFAVSHLPLSRTVHTEDDLVAITDEFSADLVLVGSDSVFHITLPGRHIQPREDTSLPNPFWLGWVEQCRRRPHTASLAASTMGTIFPLLSLEAQRTAGRMLRAMDVVTVRDPWSARMVSWLTLKRVRPSVIPDPVTVLNDVWTSETAIPTSPEMNEPYVLLGFNKHIPEQWWMDELRALLRTRGLRLYSIPTHGSAVMFGDFVIPETISPLEWYSWIKCSQGYIGGLFHTVVSCLVNNVPFVSLDWSRPRFRSASKIWNVCRQWNKEAQYVDCGRSFDKLPSPQTVVQSLLSAQARSTQSDAQHAAQLFKNALQDILRRVPIMPEQSVEGSWLRPVSSVRDEASSQVIVQ
jgi:Polysaccharide pyruvyl transferase